jgi:hypothetical protein
MRSSQRYSGMRWRAYNVRIASWSPPAIRLINASSDAASSEEVSRAAARAAAAVADFAWVRAIVMGNSPLFRVPPI